MLNTIRPLWIILALVGLLAGVTTGSIVMVRSMVASIELLLGEDDEEEPKDEEVEGEEGRDGYDHGTAVQDEKEEHDPGIQEEADSISSGASELDSLLHLRFDDQGEEALTPSIDSELVGNGSVRLARIFGAMKPADAASVLERLTDTEVRAIIKHIPDRKAAAILSHFEPERAAELTRTVMIRGG